MLCLGVLSSGPPEKSVLHACVPVGNVIGAQFPARAIPKALVVATTKSVYSESKYVYPADKIKFSVGAIRNSSSTP